MVPSAGSRALILSSVQDVKKALGTIEHLLASDKVTPSVITAMLNGFKIMTQALKGNEDAVLRVVSDWLGLFIKLHRTVAVSDRQLRRKFERTVPPAICYVMCCLQRQPTQRGNVHYRLLEMVQMLLLNVKTSTIEALMKYKSIIPCLWRTINTVGDYNSQMMALRFLAMLLKCTDSERQNTEIDRICCAQTAAMKQKLRSTIDVANYPASKFENSSRDLLNNYNMNLAKHVLVYSFCSNSLKLGDKYEFHKALSAQCLWIDLNYCPKTLTFIGCSSSGSGTWNGYDNIKVCLKVCNMLLDGNILTVSFTAPADISSSAEVFDDLKCINYARLELPDHEALKLLQNEGILQYFNGKTTSHTVDSSCDVENNENSKESTQQYNCDINVKDKRQEITKRATGVNNFQKSYKVLIGDMLETTIMPRQDECIKDNVNNGRNSKTPLLAKNDSCRQRTTNCQEDVQNVTPLLAEKESPKSSRQKISYKTMKTYFSKRIAAPHPICELRKLEHDDAVGVHSSNKASKRSSSRITKVKRKVPEKVQGHPQKKAANKKLPKTKEQARNSTENNCSGRNEIEVSIHPPEGALADLYEYHIVSDVEPGQSYRSYKKRTKCSQKKGLKSEATAKETRRQIQPKRVSKQKPLPNEKNVNNSNTNTARKNRRTTTNNRNPKSQAPKCEEYVNRTCLNKIMQIQDQAGVFSSRSSDATRTQGLFDKLTNDNLDRTRKSDNISSASSTNASKRKLRDTQRPYKRGCSSLDRYLSNSDRDSDYEDFQCYKRHVLGAEHNVTNSSKDKCKDISVTVPIDDIAECRQLIEASSFHDSTIHELPEPGHLEHDISLPDAVSILHTSNDTLATDNMSQGDNTLGEILKSKSNSPTIFLTQVQNDNILYRIHSEDESCDGDSNVDADYRLTMRESTPKTILNRTTSTHTTKQDYIFGNLKISKDLITPNVTADVRNVSDSTSKSIDITENETDLREELNSLADVHKVRINAQASEHCKSSKEKYVNIFGKKLAEISQRILDESDSARADLQELESQIDLIGRQFECLYETYAKKSNNFLYLKQKLQTFLQVLSSFKMKKEVEKDFDRIMEELQEYSYQLRTANWEKFAKNRIDGLIRNVSGLSNF